MSENETKPGDTSGGSESNGGLDREQQKENEMDQDERKKAWGLLLQMVAGKTDPQDLCWCWKCVRERDEKINGIPYEMGRMIVCSICHNKRCPHATDHAEECTNSNDPGQPGSRFE